jgi:hypothetical protein
MSIEYITQTVIENLTEQKYRVTVERDRLIDDLIAAKAELESLRQYKAEAESQPVFAMAFEKQGMRAPDDFEDYLDIIELEKVNPDELEAYQKHGRVFPLYARPVPAGSCSVPKGWHEEWDKNVRRLYLCARKHDMSIPDDQLDFMRDALVAMKDAENIIAQRDELLAALKEIFDKGEFYLSSIELPKDSGRDFYRKLQDLIAKCEAQS